jgi:hypothetical protein
VTYLERYTLKAALGIAAGKDDDAAATGIAAPEVETINSDQIQELQADLGIFPNNPAPKSLGLFLKKFEIERLVDLPASRFADAKAAIEARKKLQQAKTAPQS